LFADFSTTNDTDHFSRSSPVILAFFRALAAISAKTFAGLHHAK
jgi:hypothetical protein